MADQENPYPPANQKDSSGTSGGEVGLTMSYITSIPGILKIVEFFTLMLAFSLAADAWGGGTTGRMDFFLFVTVASWLFVIAFFILFAFNLIAKINVNLDWNIPVLGFAVLAAILLLISSSLLADEIRPLRSYGLSSLEHALNKLRAAVAFGFISMVVFIADAVVHFMKLSKRM